VSGAALALDPALLDDPLEQARHTRRVAGARGAALAETTLQLSGLHCAACAGIIEHALEATPGVESAEVQAVADRATVRWDPAATQLSRLVQAVQRTGYGAVPDAAEPARVLRRQARRTALWRLFVAAFCAMQVMMFATPAYVAAPGELSAEMARLLNWGSWVLTLPVMVFCAGPFFAGAWRGLRQRRIAMDLPVALGLAIMFGASTVATFDPAGPLGHEVYFDSVAMFVAFLLGARYVELLARQRAAEALEETTSALPATAQRLRDDGSAEAVSVLRLAAGDRVRVALGDAFPADGVIEQGSTRADEALLSGESTAVAKTPCSTVLAGSRNLGAPVVVRVTGAGADTRLEGIVALMRQAATHRPAAAALADRWAGPFLGAVLLLSLGAGLAWLHVDPARALWVAAAVLIVTCPCALALAAPATLLAATRGLARRGVLLARIDALETLAGVDRVFFDKTGTLTEDRLQVQSVHIAANVADRVASEAEALALASGLAAWSSHPLAQALAGPTADGSVWRDVAEVAGAGVEATDREGRRWRLGALGFVTAAPGVAAAEVRSAPTAAPAPATPPVFWPPGARVWLGCDGRALAAFAFEERLRPGAAQALQWLQAHGVRTALVSGDAPERAAELGARLGIAEVHGGATPETKLALLATAQAAGERVAMVGDGINDAPVLARADVSLAMGAGALVARGQADAVIVDNDLGRLVLARRAAQRAVAIVRQNLAWSAAYNALCIPLALAGWLPPWAAGLGMAASSLLVVCNAQRAGRLG
jgi:Cu2+-exporting ATPase